MTPGHPFHLRWQFPGGYLEFGETFEECAVRELLEECAVVLEPSRFHYVTTMNVRGVEFGYHNVGIFMLAPVTKAEVSPVCTEPEKNTEW
jgi:8-oxo-dGTP diphosphatase